MIAVERESPISDSLPRDSRRELLERVLASSAFAKSKRLSSLLAYLCDLTLRGRAAEINEQSVGEAVFDRPPNYDSMIDGIVRTQASRLRQRLGQYFNEEGASEPVRITIPRGSYVPIFEPRSDARQQTPENASTAAAISEVHASEPPPALRSSRIAVFAWCIVLVLAATLGIVIFRDEEMQRQSHIAATSHLLWSKLFEPGQRTLLIPGDSSLVIWQGLKNRNIDLDEYVSGTYRTVKPEGGSVLDNIATDLGGRRYTSIVDLEIAQALSRISSTQGSKIEVRYPREVGANDLKQGNLILVGASEADPWVTLFERDMDFSFFNDRARHVFALLNRSPRMGEPHEWDSVNTDREHRVYSVVAYMPNLSGNGNVLILEGTTMAGTECAWDFVSDDSRLLPFLRSIRKPDGSLPYFEVVLKTNNVNGSAVESTILASRVR